MSMSRQTAARALAKMITGGVNSRRGLETELGLRKASVSRTVNGLIRRGVVWEGRKLDADTRGRKAVSLKIRPDSAYLLGTDLEGLAVRACVLDARQRVVEQAKRAISRRWSANRILETWAALIREVLDKADVPPDRIAGIGAGLPGIVGSDGFCTHAYLPPGQWIDLDARKPLAQLGLPVITANNGLCVADYEHRLGAARGRESFLLILARYGLGAVMYGNGRFLVGERMFTCEFGQVGYPLD